MSKIIAKTIITKSQLPEVDYCCNLYIGCSHRCAYCYARFMGRFTGHAGKPWGTYLDYKINAPELLRKEAPKIKKQGGTVIIGSVTDCYQPMEEKLQLTRRCLEVFLEHQIPISILTKNDLVARDFDLLQQFESCDLGFSISLLDEKDQKILEPGASTPQQRINTLAQAHKLGITAYAFIGPIHPFLTDIDQIFEQIKPFVNFIMGEVPNLRCGNWNDLAKALVRLSVDPAEYSRQAKSKQFYLRARDLIEKLCQSNQIEFRGVFEH